MLCLGNLMLCITTWKQFKQDYKENQIYNHDPWTHTHTQIQGSGDSVRFQTHFILCSMMKSNFQIFKTLQFRQGDVQDFIVQYIWGLQNGKYKNNLHPPIRVKEHFKNSRHMTDTTPDCNGLAYLTNDLLPDI